MALARTLERILPRLYCKCMFYYFVWVRSNRYHGNTPLTYSSDQQLETGAIVEVELQQSTVMGVVSGRSTEPKFRTKNITKIYNLPAIPAHLIKLCEWLIKYYPAPLGLAAQQLVPASLSDKIICQDTKFESIKPRVSNLPPLSTEQKTALNNMVKPNSYLVHGNTGSGKTRLYIELALKAINNNKSAVILTPEISLTSQLYNSFSQVFGDRVIVLHSKQTPSQRQRAWLHCLKAKVPVIVIGPRSALFVPIKNLGLIVLDEAHEGAYKQEQAPQYQSTRVAGYLAKLTGATLLLGSATPLISDYFLATQKNRSIIKLKALARGEPEQPTQFYVVDRKDHSQFSRSSYLSQTLIEQISSALNRGEQSLLYLNRRGTARLVMCENCGWQAICPNCNLPLTYHGDKHQMRCHSCSYYTKAPSSCPSCKYTSIVFKTAGTKAIVDDAKKIFPNSVVVRFDTDNLKAESFEQNYEAARDGKIDILVGTQMLAKGLDLPKLSVVGIVLADTSLYVPDFSAEERTFQLINQVIGRIGRGHVAGKAVVQTYNPDNKLLKFALSSDYEGFYDYEIKSRQKFLFPPYCHLLKLTAKRATMKGVELAASNLKRDLQASGLKIKVEGPAPAFYELSQGKYQWQLVVKSPERSELLRVIAMLPANWSYDIDPVDLL